MGDLKKIIMVWMIVFKVVEEGGLVVVESVDVVEDFGFLIFVFEEFMKFD